MLGIIRKPKCFNCLWWWIYHWIQIIDLLVGILSLEFVNTTLIEWWKDIENPSFEWEIPLSLKERVKWWIGDWIMILESLVTILTLGHFTAIWSNWFFNLDDDYCSSTWIMFRRK